MRLILTITAFITLALGLTLAVNTLFLLANHVSLSAIHWLPIGSALLLATAFFCYRQCQRVDPKPFLKGPNRANS